MKKYLLPIIIVFLLLAIPVAADTPYRLIVDGVVVDKPVVIINNLSYVPVRAIADIFNATTEWDGATKTISISTRELNRPPINGDQEFIAKINAALDLLEEKDFPHYVMVVQNTVAIKQTEKKPNDCPDNSVASSNTLRETLIHPRLIENTDQYVPVFLAGILTHEACHILNWRLNKDTPENEAYTHQLTVFNLLDAPQWMKDWSTR